MKFRNAFAVAVVLTAAVASQAQATVVAGPTIGGLATFTDTNTGRNWLKLNDFFNMSGTDMIAAATAAGFTVAVRSDVEGLVGSLPLNVAGNWASFAAVMGSAPNRGLMWAAYAPDPNGNLGWAYAFDADSSWSFVDNAFPANQISNGGGQFADENLWAFFGGGAVPEPATWALMLTGFGLAGSALRRRRAGAVA